MPQARPLLLAAALAVAVASVAQAQDSVLLSSGDTIKGSVVEKTEQEVVVQHADLGRITIPTDKIVKITPAKGPNPGLLGTGFLTGWTRSAELALSGTEGNTQSLNLMAALTGTYEDKTDRWRVSAVYTRTSADNDLTRNDFTAAVLKDWLFPEKPHFYFAQGKYEYDDFRSWLHRVSGHGGIGYQFHKSEKWDLLGRLGAGGAYEFGDINEFTPEALLGLEYNLNLTDNQKLSAYTTFYPALDPFFGEFRNITGVAYKAAISAEPALSLKVGIENEYESEVEPDEKKNDLRYFAGIVWDF